MTALDAAPRHILHADLDAFYASVEALDRPELRGKPVIVGGSPRSRGVVASCSYEARAFGVRSAMPVGAALRLCPSAAIVPPRFDRYRELSERVMDIFHDLTPLVEPMSLDEAYLDVTELVAHGASPGEVAQRLKERVRREVGLTISVGAGASKVVAKIASALGKPDGLVAVAPGTERAFLAPLPVRRLPGVGPKTEQRLAEAGIRLLEHLQSQPVEWLEATFGRRGPELVSLSRGEDSRPVTPPSPARSVGAEATFPRDLGDRAELGQELARLCGRVTHRLREAGVGGRTVTLKLRLADFTTFTRSLTLAAPVEDAALVQEVAQGLLDREMAPGRRFRLLGVAVSHLATGGQMELFPPVSSIEM